MLIYCLGLVLATSQRKEQERYKVLHSPPAQTSFCGHDIELAVSSENRKFSSRYEATKFSTRIGYLAILL
jgi:hypothetical protein